MNRMITGFKPASITQAPTPAAVYFEELHQVISSCIVTIYDGSIVSMDHAVDLALKEFDQVRSEDRKLILVGNGGSAAVANHEALDFWNAGKIRAIAFTSAAHLTCLSNDYGYENVYSKSIEMFADAGDILIAISSSGNSENILNAVKAARVKQCKIITFSGFAANNPLRKKGDLNFYLRSNSYGHVEVGHLSIIHYLTDMVKKALEDSKK